MKEAKLKDFEEKKKEADLKVTKEFESQLSDPDSYTPPNAKMPDDNKLAVANKKIADL
jgi:hypothetical protein